MSGGVARLCFLPLLSLVARQWPAQPGAWRMYQGIKEDDLSCLGQYGLNKGFLFLASVVANDPGINNAGCAVGCVAVLPLLDCQGRALELQRPLLSVWMAQEDVGDAIGLW